MRGLDGSGVMTGKAGPTPAFPVFVCYNGACVEPVRQAVFGDRRRREIWSTPRREPMKGQGVVKTKTKWVTKKMAQKKVADLTVADLTDLIEYIVERALDERLGDPDAGLELTDELKERLRRSLASKEPGIPAEEVYAELGLKRRRRSA